MFGAKNHKPFKSDWAVYSLTPGAGAGNTWVKAIEFARSWGGKNEEVGATATHTQRPGPLAQAQSTVRDPSGWQRKVKRTLRGRLAQIRIH